MKIHAIKHDSASSQLDLNEFAKELRVLSDRFGVTLVSLGAMATVETVGKSATYIAIWSTEPKNQGN